MAAGLESNSPTATESVYVVRGEASPEAITNSLRALADAWYRWNTLRALRVLRWATAS